jgi:acylphosphatase
MANARLNIIISGRVQGVGFRYFVERLASQMGLVGFARNLPNGSVEAVAEGEESDLKKLLAALVKGPSSADILDVKTTWLPPTGEFRDFGIRHW